MEFVEQSSWSSAKHPHRLAGNPRITGRIPKQKRTARIHGVGGASFGGEELSPRFHQVASDGKAKRKLRAIS